MIEWMRMDRPERETSSPQSSLIPPDSGSHDAKDLHDGRTKGRYGARGTPSDVVGHPPPLSVGNVGQRDEGLGVRDGIWLLDGVTHGIDVGVAGLVVTVHGNSAARPDSEPGPLGQVDIRPDADRTDSNLCVDDAVRRPG